MGVMMRKIRKPLRRGEVKGDRLKKTKAATMTRLTRTTRTVLRALERAATVVLSLFRRRKDGLKRSEKSRPTTMNVHQAKTKAAEVPTCLLKGRRRWRKRKRNANKEKQGRLSEKGREQEKKRKRKNAKRKRKGER